MTLDDLHEEWDRIGNAGIAMQSQASAEFVEKLIRIAEAAQGVINTERAEIIEDELFAPLKAALKSLEYDTGESE